MMASNDLPEDLVEEILCHVPTMSLKRLRSTCKRWNCLYNDIRFARKHFDKASPGKQFLVLMSKRSFKFCSMSVDLHGIPSLEVKGRKVSVIDPCSSGQFHVSNVFHCDGLLLVQSHTRIVVWNPCTGQTRWIEPRSSSLYDTYVFGSYQEYKKTGSTSSGYKILSYRRYGFKQEFAIFEINSNTNSCSWRNLDVIQDFTIKYDYSCVSLKGKTYWFAVDKQERKAPDIFLLSFNYTKERFKRVPLPHQCPSDYYGNFALSVVGEEKLSVLLQHNVTWRQEIWVINKVYKTKLVSWTKVFDVDLGLERPIFITSFLVDEENKMAMFCEKCVSAPRKSVVKMLVCIVGDDNKVTQVDNFGAGKSKLCWPYIFSYVPSLVQIPRGVEAEESSN